MQNKKIRIAGCYIVRNEEKVLEKSLKSIKHAVDELLVVDTGSTDQTIEIARAHGARVISHEWKDDFSEARNFALEQLDADWVVFLDADEYFTEETKTNIRSEIIKADGEGTDLLLLMWRNIDADTGVHLVDVYTPRIFRLKQSLRYKGKIHEQLRDNGELVKKVKAVPDDMLLLIHTGYSVHLSKVKAERNLQLLLKDMEKSPHPEEQYMAVAEAYDGLDDAENAMKYAYMDIANGRQSSTYASRSYRILLRRLAENSAAYDKRREVAGRAAKDFPELPEFHAELAECLAYVFRFEEAIEEAQSAMHAFEEYHSLEPLQFDSAMCEGLKKRILLWKRILICAEKITVSACLIAKNEEKELPGWLKNASVYADQIIIADTGSADDTAGIALKAGAEVISYTWQDDFAEAKNLVCAKATGDWVAFLDADETFDAPERVKAMLAEIEILHPEAEAVRLYIVNVDEDDGGREFHRFMNIRLFKNRKGLHYTGRVHENLLRENGDLPVSYEEKYRLMVRHTGYSTGRVMKKARRNLRLLQKDIEENGEGPQHYIYLANVYSTLGNPAEALRYARLAKKAPLQGVGTKSDMDYLELQCMRWLDYSIEERMDAAKLAVERFPALPEFHAIQGELFLLAKKTEEAKGSFESAFKLVKQTHSSGEASHLHGILPLIYRGLAAVAHVEGKSSMAKENIMKALKENPYDEETLNLYCDIYEKEKPEVIAHNIRSLFSEKESDLHYVLQWAEHSGHIRLYLCLLDMCENTSGKPALLKILYEKKRNGELNEVYEGVVKGLSDCFERLVTSLILLEKMDGVEAQQLSMRCWELLPAGAAAVWAAYQGQQMEFFEDGYRVILPIMLQQGDDEQLTRFGTLAAAFSAEMLYQTAKQAMEAERWAPAVALLGQIPADANVMGAAVWTEIGICLYHLKEWESAEECFSQAVLLDCETAEIAAYRTWMKEGR